MIVVVEEQRDGAAFARCRIAIDRESTVNRCPLHDRSCVVIRLFAHQTTNTVTVYGELEDAD